jgi:hypothetical protein
VKAFVITRDRVTYARQCVETLQAIGLDVVIVDHDSRFPPMVEWLADLELYADEVSQDGVPWIVWGDNRHPRDLWRPGGPIAQLVPPGERYIVTDCDVVPDSDIRAASWWQLLGDLLDANPRAVKAGLGLRTDDLPEHYAGRAQVQAWEARFQPPHARPVDRDSSPPGVWADIDTTLAMYRGTRFALGPAIRTTAPYLARHLPWYEDSANPTPEQVFYRKRAEFGHWRNPDGFVDTHNLEA